MSLRIQVAPDPAGTAAQALEGILAAQAGAVAARGRFVLSLAGGSTPKAIYRRWAAHDGADWGRVHLVYGDERCVPPEHPDSNHRMVTECLLAALPAPPAVYRMEGEAPDPAAAAARYAAVLRNLLGPGGRIDLALLGMGDDGHTASLFPGRPALGERDRAVVDTLAPDGQTRRISLAVPTLQAARALAFVVTGAGKAAVLREVVEGPLAPERLPAQLFVRDPALDVTLYLDAAAAARLTG